MTELGKSFFSYKIKAPNLRGYVDVYQCYIWHKESELIHVTLEEKKTKFKKSIIVPQNWTLNDIFNYIETDNYSVSSRFKQRPIRINEILNIEVRINPDRDSSYIYKILKQETTKNYIVTCTSAIGKLKKESNDKEEIGILKRGHIHAIRGHADPL